MDDISQAQSTMTNNNSIEVEKSNIQKKNRNIKFLHGKPLQEEKKTIGHQVKIH